MDPCCSYGRSPNVQLEFSLSNFRAIPVGSTWTNQQRRFGSNMFKWWSFLVSMFIFKSENSIKFSARHHYSCICRAWAIIEPHNVPGHTGTTHFLQLSPRNIQSSHREEKKKSVWETSGPKSSERSWFFLFFLPKWKLENCMSLWFWFLHVKFDSDLTELGDVSGWLLHHINCLPTSSEILSVWHKPLSKKHTFTQNLHIHARCIDNPPTRVGVHSFFSYVASKILSQGAHPKSPVQNPKSKIPKIQNPKSPKSKIQNPQNPKSKIPKFQNPNFAHKDLLHNVPKIQNPKSPKSRKSKIQNPQNPKSKIQNPQNPKSKIPKIQNPKSKIPTIQNPKSPKSQKSKIQNPQNPKSKIPKIQNPSFFGRILGILDFGFWGFWILDFGFGIPAPKSKIQTPQNPKSKIQNPQNPKSKIPKIQNPKSKIPKIQNPKSPKSKIQNPPPKSKIWGVGGLT